MPEGNSLLDALAHPTVVNPLEAYQGAARTANSIWQTRDWQARQAAGEAQQGAIDPATGEYSPEKMRQGLAAAGPSGALAAQSSLAANQALSSDQLNQARDKLGWVAKASGAALTAGDYSDAAMMRVMLQGSADRMMTMPEIVRQLQSMPADPAGRKAWLEQHQNQAMSTAQQLELRYGASGNTIGPDGRLTGYKQSIQTGGLSSPQQPGVPMGPSPDTVFTAPPAMVPDTRPGASPGTYAPTPRSFPQPSTSPAAGGTAPPIPGTGGYTPPKTAGYQPRGGAPAADGTPAPVGGAPQPQTYLAAPQGQPATLENDQKIAFTASDAMNAQQKRAIAGETALQALKLARTGPGTATEAQYQAFLEAHGIAVPDKAGLSATDYRQLLKKNLLRFAQDSGKAAGTDLQLTEKLASNPNVDEMTNPANEHVLVQDMGILRRDMAMTRAMPQPSGTGSVAEHVKKFPGDTDPRAFAIDLMSPSDRAALLQEAAKQGPDGKIYRSLKLAHDHGHIALPSGP